MSDQFLALRARELLAPFYAERARMMQDELVPRSQVYAFDLVIDDLDGALYLASKYDPESIPDIIDDIHQRIKEINHE
jgi:hypothetical protein